MRMLIAFGSKMGGTEGLATMLAGDLQDLGHEVDVRPAADVDSVEPYEAVIVGARSTTS